MSILHKYLLSSVYRNAEGAGAGTPPAAWYENKDLGLDDDTKIFIAGKKTPDLKTGLKSWMEADNHARNRNVIDRPDPKKLNEWKGWTDLGWVEDPAKYEVKAPEANAIKFPYNAAIMGSIKTIAHEQRVPLAAAQAIHDGLLQAYGKEHDAIEARGASSLAALQTELDQAWGADKDRNTELARRAARTIFADVPGADFKKLEEALGGAPALLKALHAHGAKLGEANLIGTTEGGGGGAPQTLAELRAELNRMQGDKDFMAAFRNNRHPQHHDRVNQRQAVLDKIARFELKTPG
jgi:hypothetical protein